MNLVPRLCVFSHMNLCHLISKSTFSKHHYLNWTELKFYSWQSCQYMSLKMFYCLSHNTHTFYLFSEHLTNPEGSHGQLVSPLSLSVEGIRSRYSMDKPFECHQCHKRYYLKKTLMRHLRLECNKEPQFQCPLCGKKFKQKSHLKTHILKVENPQSLKMYHKTLNTSYLV